MLLLRFRSLDSLGILPVAPLGTGRYSVPKRRDLEIAPEN
jgi:hypothetical protein